jgi:hypothetical protein
LEFISEYDFEIKHIKGKENQVDDALNMRAHEVHIAAINMCRNDMKDQIIATTNSDQHYLKIKGTLQQGYFQQKFNCYELKDDGILMYKGKLYVLNSSEMKNTFMKEIHNVPYVGHLGYQKTLATVRSQYFWPRMKKEVANYIVICIECQKVKTKHRHPTCLLQPFPIPEWKWEVVTIDFITKLPRTMKQHDSIMVVVDKLTKTTHFIPVKTTHKPTNIVDIYMKEVARIHGIPKEIVSDRDPKFTSNCWKCFFKGFGTNLNISTTYHPESDGKTKRTNMIIEDMLRMHVMDQPSKWEDYIHLVEFSYNNEYHASLKMSQFETLYGRKCNTLVSWDNPANRAVVGP